MDQCLNGYIVNCNLQICIQVLLTTYNLGCCTLQGYKRPECDGSCLAKCPLAWIAPRFFGMARHFGSERGSIHKCVTERASKITKPARKRSSKTGCLGLYGQVNKRTWWMPWRQQAMKDVVICDKPRGADKRALIRGFPNGETRPFWVIAN